MYTRTHISICMHYACVHVRVYRVSRRSVALPTAGVAEGEEEMRKTPIVLDIVPSSSLK